jgi:acyl-CoA thioester hydrolase
MTSNQNGLGAHSIETAYTMSRIAQDHECDELGHVNNAIYVDWVQDIATRHWFTIAKGPLLDNHVWICLRHEIDYREPVLPGEEVEIRTWLGSRSGPRFDRHTDIRKPGLLRGSARAITTWVMVDRETRRPKRIGNDVLEAFGVDPEHHS